MKIARVCAVAAVVGVSWCLFIGTVPASGQAAVAPAVDTKGLLIRRVLKLTNAADYVVTAIEGAIPAQRAANPQMPKEFWDELGTRARAETPRLLDMLVRVYDAQFSVVELEQLVAFYESPVGRHLIEAQPVIMAQTVHAGQQWGTQLGAQVAQELRRRGIQAPHTGDTVSAKPARP